MALGGSTFDPGYKKGGEIGNKDVGGINLLRKLGGYQAIRGKL